MDKVIVITGASGGIGAALAELLGKQGARLALAARRKQELEAVAARCGSEALAVGTDVTRRAEVERLRDQALQRFGRIDVWVNNAGRGISRAVSELSDDDMDQMWRDNVKSALYGMQAVLPHLQQRNAGQIVNVSSGLARLPFAPIRSAYSAAKHALNGISACLRLELAATHPGVMVTVVMPRVVATDFGLNALGGGADSRRLPNAQPVEEVARVIAEAIEHPRPDVYTAAGMQEQVVAYYRDVAGFEANLSRRR